MFLRPISGPIDNRLSAQRYHRSPRSCSFDESGASLGARREHGATVLILSEIAMEFPVPLVSNVFSFGAFAIEVRPTSLATYSVGGGETGNLSSA